MKKLLGIISILLVSILFIGCTTNNSAAQVKLATQKINSGINNMISQINKLTEVDNSKISLEGTIYKNHYNNYIIKKSIVKSFLKVYNTNIIGICTFY